MNKLSELCARYEAAKRELRKCADRPQSIDQVAALFAVAGFDDDTDTGPPPMDKPIPAGAKADNK